MIVFEAVGRSRVDVDEVDFGIVEVGMRARGGV